MPTAVTIALARAIGAVIKKLRLGSGSTWPGEIALRLQPTLIKKILEKNPELQVVCVVGTNGKTTTSKLLVHVLRGLGKRVITNDTGANLLNGVAATLLEATGRGLRIAADVAVLELDENVLPRLLEHIEPSALVLLNLFRDQLDRYGEVRTIADRWTEALARHTSVRLYVNGQDPLLVCLGLAAAKTGSKVTFVGLQEDEIKAKGVAEVGAEADSQFCPICGERLRYTAVAYSHIGIFSCPTKDLATPKNLVTPGSLTVPLVGLFNRYNLAAAFGLLHGEFKVSEEQAQPVLNTFTASFGRQETVRYNGAEVVVQLSKNPTGFNQSIQVVREHTATRKHVLVILNDRTPDGKDISWIWDTHFEDLLQSATSITLTGDRAYDLGIRFAYAVGVGARVAPVQSKMVRMPNWQLEARQTLGGIVSPDAHAAGQVVSISHPDMPEIRVVPSLQAALDYAAGQAIADDALLFVLPTYSAMLEVRTKLTGEAITV